MGKKVNLLAEVELPVGNSGCAQCPPKEQELGNPTYIAGELDIARHYMHLLDNHFWFFLKMIIKRKVRQVQGRGPFPENYLQPKYRSK